MRLLARSQVRSDLKEKWADASDDPKGSLVSSTPMSLSFMSCHIVMHFIAIVGVT
jgi:hypothetical protein